MNTHEHSYKTDITRTENHSSDQKQVDFSFCLELEAMALQPFTIAEPLPELTFDLQRLLRVSIKCNYPNTDIN